MPTQRPWRTTAHSFGLGSCISLCLPGPPRVDQALPYQSLIKKIAPQVNLMEAVLQLRSPVTLIYIGLTKLTPIHHQNTNWVNSRCFFMISYMYTVHWGLLPTSHHHNPLLLIPFLCLPVWVLFMILNLELTVRAWWAHQWYTPGYHTNPLPESASCQQINHRWWGPYECLSPSTAGW